ncbi:superoxide dismutase, Fe-Mn family, partial [Phenoliferia sp. Uapishka_3]
MLASVLLAVFSALTLVSASPVQVERRGDEGAASFQLFDLPYSVDALEPFISAKTNSIHLTLLQGAAAALRAQSALIETELTSPSINFTAINEASTTIAKVTGALELHFIYFNSLAPVSSGGGDTSKASPEFAAQVRKDFGSFDNLIAALDTEVLAVPEEFGSRQAADLSPRHPASPFSKRVADAFLWARTPLDRRSPLKLPGRDELTYPYSHHVPSRVPPRNPSSPSLLPSGLCFRPQEPASDRNATQKAFSMAGPWSTMTHAAGTIYPPGPWRTVTVVLYLVGLCTLSSMLTRRTPPHYRDWSRISGLKGSFLGVLASSLMYVAAAAIYTLGVGTSSSEKFWGTSAQRADGACITHDSPAMAFATLGVEILLNLYLGCLFAYPLYRGFHNNAKIRWLAIKSLISIFVVLASSSACIAVFSILGKLSAISVGLIIPLMFGWMLKGAHELSWVCMTTCTLDCWVSAVCLYALTCGESACADSKNPSPSSSARNFSHPSEESNKPLRPPIHSRISSRSITFTQMMTTTHSMSEHGSPSPNLATLSPFHGTSEGCDVGVAIEEGGNGSIAVERGHRDSKERARERSREHSIQLPPAAQIYSCKVRRRNLRAEASEEDDPGTWRGDCERFEGTPSRKMASWEDGEDLEEQFRLVDRALSHVV